MHLNLTAVSLSGHIKYHSGPDNHVIQAVGQREQNP